VYHQDSQLINYKEAIEESAEDLYERAPCGYLSCLPDGTIVKINQTMLDWIDYSREEVLYLLKFQHLLSIGSKIFYETHYRPLMGMQGFVKEINYDFLRKDSSSFPALVNTQQIKDKEGKLLLYRTTVFDISDRKKYERELLAAKKKAEAATKAKAHFLSTVSHEIRTPLNAVIGITNLLVETAPKPEQAQLLSLLHSSAGHLLNLVNDILDFSKIESGKILLEEKEFNIRELVNSIIYSQGVKAEEKGLTIHSLIDNTLPAMLIGDPVKLTQVITNLVSNAVKFTTKGSVTIKLLIKEKTPGMVSIVFSVSDTGIGIPKEKQELIFEEFNQGGYEINQKYGGTGLGLAISRKLLDLYGSKLTVASEPNVGSVFSFLVNLRISKQTLQASIVDHENVAQSDSLKGVKLLIAEDNEVNVLVLKQFLTKWGADFERVENGYQAVEKVQKTEYDLVLMDLQMPQMDGYEASRRIRKLAGEKYTTLPIIALSAFSKEEVVQELMAAGMNDFVGKPFEPKDLFAKIAGYTADKKKSISPSAPIVIITTQTSAVSPNEPSSNLTSYRKITSNNAKELSHLLELSIRDLTHFKTASVEALEKGDREAFEKLSHKNRTLIKLLEANKLDVLITKALESLQTGSTIPEENHMLALQEEMEVIIETLQEELNTLR
jgi:PAS domain S-box-containing protein